MMQENILGTEKISKLFIKFSIPAILSLTIAGVQTMVDGIFLGNFVGTNAMASVNIAAPFMQLMIGMNMIVGIGGASYIGRSLGEKDFKRAQDIFKSACLFMLGLSLIVACLGFTFNQQLATFLGANEVLLAEDFKRAQDIFKSACLFMLGLSLIVACLGFTFNQQLATFLGANEVLLADSATYIKILALFAPFISFSFILGIFVRCIGKPNVFLFSSIASFFANIILNYVLIKQLKLGIVGAPIATGLSFTTSFLIAAIPFIKKSSVLNFFTGTFNLKFTGQLLYNGSSEGISSLATAISTFVFNMAFMEIAGEDGVSAFTAIGYISLFASLIVCGISAGIGATAISTFVFNMAFMEIAGEDGVSAFTAIGYISLFASLIVCGISAGIGPVISYNYGAKLDSRVKQMMSLSCKVAIVMGTILVFTIFLFGKYLILLHFL